jgi:hypothetical protein
MIPSWIHNSQKPATSEVLIPSWIHLSHDLKMSKNSGNSVKLIPSWIHERRISNPKKHANSVRLIPSWMHETQSAQLNISVRASQLTEIPSWLFLGDIKCAADEIMIPTWIYENISMSKDDSQMIPFWLFDHNSTGQQTVENMGISTMMTVSRPAVSKSAVLKTPKVSKAKGERVRKQVQKIEIIEMNKHVDEMETGAKKFKQDDLNVPVTPNGRTNSMNSPMMQTSVPTTPRMSISNHVY